MKQLTREEAKDILKQLSPEELAIYKELNAEVGGLNEADIKAAVQNIKSNWKNWSTAMLMAIMMNANMNAAIKSSAPDVYNAINTEISTDTTAVKTTPTSIPGSVKSISFNESFASGKATLTNKDELVKSINELKDWMKGKKINNFKLIITAGESQVTNQKGFEKKGSLAQARAKAVENVVDKLGFDKVDVQTQIGTTPYEKGGNINDPKYQAEQFVTVNIVVDNNVCNMPPVDETDGQGVASNNFITYDDYISGKGTLVFTPGQIPDRLVILDVNGNIKEDTGYITTQASKYKDWKYTPKYVLELTLRYKSNPKAFTGNKIKTITVKDYDDLLTQLKTNPNQTNISFSGDEIGPALNAMQKMINKGQKEFIIYDLGTTPAVVNFNDTRGDVKAIVYSPVGKTGFGIKGNCTR